MAILSGDLRSKKIVSCSSNNLYLSKTTCSELPQNFDSVNEPKKQDKASGDSDGNSTVFQLHSGKFPNCKPRAKITLLPNSETLESVSRSSGSSPLTIKSPEVGVCSNKSIIEQLLTVPEVAKILRVSNTTLYRMIEDRKVSFVRIGNMVRFTRANLDKIVGDRHINPII